ncbi:MAG: hypothetical protein ACYC5Y_04555 [Symbiobacteriia bacterium]
MFTRLLTSSDAPAVATLCGGTPQWDIFLLANLGQLAGDGSMVQYWGQFANDGALKAALMRYHVLWYVYTGPGADLPALAEIIRDQAQPHIVLNEGNVAAPQLAPLLTDYKMDLSLRGHLRCLPATRALAVEADDCPSGNVGLVTRRATLGDVDRLAAFYADAPQDVRRGPDNLRRSVTGDRRAHLAEAAGSAAGVSPGEVVACALTTAELSGVAMLGGLFAVPESRREAHLGLALRALVGSLAAAGKDACIVSRDPWIDAVLDRLAFETLGPWWMLHMSPSH